jgi:hypothetical protein
MMKLINKDRTVAEPEARLSELAARMEQLGADDPAGWARSEIQENIAQQARYLFLTRTSTLNNLTLSRRAAGRALADRAALSCRDVPCSVRCRSRAGG